jgi:hypothetical protein
MTARRQPVANPAEPAPAACCESTVLDGCCLPSQKTACCGQASSAQSGSCGCQPQTETKE